jgi:integral membrane protein
MSLQFSNTGIGRLRMAGIAEGISYVVLLFIAMPIKYIAGNPGAVWYIGWVHGLLFMLFILALITVKINMEWNFKRTFLAFVAALLPFGTFILDKSLRKEEKIFLHEKAVK